MKNIHLITALALVFCTSTFAADKDTISCDDVTQANQVRIEFEQDKYSQGGSFDDIYEEAENIADAQNDCMSQLAQAMENIDSGGVWGDVLNVIQSETCKQVDQAVNQANQTAIDYRNQAGDIARQATQTPDFDLDLPSSGQDILNQAYDSFAK